MKKACCLLLALWLCLCCAAAWAAGFCSDPDAIEQAAQAVLLLEIYDSRGREIATGSGFVLFDARTLVTNYHVIEDGARVTAEGDDGARYEVSGVLVADEDKDIAILRFAQATAMRPLQADQDAVKRGSSVVAIGSPNGLKNTVSLGNVSLVTTEDGIRWIQFTAPISSGSSGGVLLNDDGRVIGVTSASYVEGQNLNLAISISEVLDLYARWDGRTVYRIADYRDAVSAAPTTKQTTAPGSVILGIFGTPAPTEKPGSIILAPFMNDVP